MDFIKIPLDSSQELCFDKSDFEKSNFSVDEFLDRRGTNFETLRDDLGQYLKELRSAMIELINQDYSDFVNLSSNLIGLDKSIGKLKVPLGQFKEEILHVKSNLDEAIDELTVQLHAREQLRQYRKSLTNLQNLLILLDKMELVLSHTDDGVNLERLSMQFSRSLVCLANCRDVSREILNKHQKYENALFNRLDEKFIFELKSEPGVSRSNAVLECLRIYASLENVSHAEDIYRTEIMSPLLSERIKEKSLKSTSVSILFDDILTIITDDKSSLKLLIGLTSGSDQLNVFDFIINSYWCEVCERLVNNLQSIFAPGNPDEFYVKYVSTTKFLDRIEISLNSHKKVQQFRNRNDYKNFISKWNLPVYYQIRFQEIAGSVEEAIQTFKKSDKTDGEFQLKISQVTWAAVEKCWQPGIFLPQLTHRFWKLTLQIISRFQVWSAELVKNFRDDGDGMLFLALLHHDLNLFSHKIPSLLELLTTCIKLDVQLNTLLKGNLEEISKVFDELRSKVVEKIVELGNFKGEIIKSVTDIPRIYRKTNRDVPTKAGVYVARFLSAAKEIGHSTKFTSVLNNNTREEIIFKLISNITETYLNAVKDLLTSVQKTEESLRRLKQIRDKTSSSNAGSSHSGQVSDDDKIRIQILLDCREFKAQVEAVGISSEQISTLCELSALVEKSVMLPNV